MSKKHDWMDYTNLAANLAQANRLAEIQQELARLQQAEANKQRQVEIEDKLRQFIFDWEQKIDFSLSGSTATAPKATFIAAKLIDRIFDNAGVDPASFQQFADKDRVKQVQSKLWGVIVNCRQQLDTSEQEEAVACAKFIEEQSLLDRFIVTQGAREQLATTEDTWRQLDEAEARRVRPRRILGGLLALFGVISCGMGENVIRFSSKEIPPNLIYLACTLVGMALLTIGLFLILSYKPRELHTKLKAQRQLLKAQIPSQDELKKLVSKFGDDIKSSELIAMRDDRSERIFRAVAFNKNGSLLRSSPIAILKS